MSRIGLRPIDVPNGVTVSVDEATNVVTVKGPKGELTQPISRLLSLSQEDGKLQLSRPNNLREARSQHGLARTLVSNMIEGVTKGHSKTLEIVGVGYRATMEGKNLLLNMGYSHPVRVAAEKGVTRGTSGNFNAFNLVKDFGFNLIDWRNAQRARALNTLSTVYGMAPRVNIMSPMSSMVDPGTALGVAARNNETQFNVDQAGLNSQAAASNYNRSLLGGVLQSTGTLLGAQLAQRGVQQKAGTAPTAGTNTSAKLRPDANS